VYPAEVERVLGGHPGVAQCAVVGVPDTDRGEAPAAFVVAADPGAPPEPAELFAHLRERLASYKQPRHLWFVDALPMTAVPKVDKVALAADARARLGLGADEVSGR
jgi:acyl-CoA synthetase (AMP-forming)/AMP-acid ligase II